MMARSKRASTHKLYHHGMHGLACMHCVIHEIKARGQQAVGDSL